MTDNLDKVIELQEQKLNLLKEYRESLAYEKCTHHLVWDSKYYKKYFLVLISTGNIVKDGYGGKIKHYIRLRKIDTNLIYNWVIMEPDPKPKEEE